MEITSILSTPLQMDCTILRIALGSKSKTKNKKDQTDAKANFATRFLNFASTHARPPEVLPTQEPINAQDPLEALSASVFLRMITAKSRFSAPAAFIAEIERSTKKKPPSTSSMQLLFTSKDEADAGKAIEEQAGALSPSSIFAGLVQEAGNQGRVTMESSDGFIVRCADFRSSRFSLVLQRTNLLASPV